MNNNVLKLNNTKDSLLDTKSDLVRIFENLYGLNTNGFVIRTNDSSLDLESCNGIAMGDNEKSSCALCVALNRTIFHNFNKPNFYHRYCKCGNGKTILTKVNVELKMDKITNYLFKNVNKARMMKSMGYYPEDAETICEIIKDNVNERFLSNQYILKGLDCYGQKVQINYVLSGKNDHKGQKYNVYTGAVAYPYGKLYIATPLVLINKKES